MRKGVPCPSELRVLARILDGIHFDNLAPTTQEIADSLGINIGYVSVVIHRLIRGGLLESNRPLTRMEIRPKVRIELFPEFFRKARS